MEIIKIYWKIGNSIHSYWYTHSHVILLKYILYITIIYTHCKKVGYLSHDIHQPKSPKKTIKNAWVWKAHRPHRRGGWDDAMAMAAMAIRSRDSNGKLWLWLWSMRIQPSKNGSQKWSHKISSEWPLKICCRMKFFPASDSDHPKKILQESLQAKVVGPRLLPPAKNPRGFGLEKCRTGVLRSYLPRGIRVPNAGNPRILDVISMAWKMCWNPVEFPIFHGSYALTSHDIPWNPVKFYEVAWKSYEIHWNRMKILWKSHKSPEMSEILQPHRI